MDFVCPSWGVFFCQKKLGPKSSEFSTGGLNESPGYQQLFMGDSASLSPSCSSHPRNTGVLAVENKETKRLYLTRSSSDL